METLREQFAKELKNLEITNEDIITARFVTIKFKRRALKVHSDKTHTGDDEEFKELLNDYKRVIDAIEKIGNNEEKMDVKTDLQEFFQKHNLAKEFTQSWTIFIEKENLEGWNREMVKRFPDPKFLQGNGTQFKSSIEEGNVFTTLYDVSVPKMNIQGNQRSIRKFVIDVLPEIYRAVSEGSHIGAQKRNALPLNTRVKLSAETTYTCDICDKKYIRKPALRKHIQVKHATTVGDVQNRMCLSSQPIPLPSSISFVENDDDSQEEDDAPLTLEENDEVVEETGPQQVETNWQCSECGEMFTTETQLTEHMSQEHKDESWQCTKCGKTYGEERQLNDHVQDHYRKYEKAFELLERRHEALKEKYEEAIKKNKEYAKDIFKYITENAELKSNAETDAEALADTLSINQVLVEEIKVKDKIIETNELINKNKKNDEDEILIEDTGTTINGSEGTWSTTKKPQLAGNMYACEKCDQTFPTKTEHNKHKTEAHVNTQNGRVFTCITCDSKFESEHSVKQHMQSKHKSASSFPVGHPQRYARVQPSSMNIACTKCNKRFATGNQVEDHMSEHDEDSKFTNPQDAKLCRYFRRGRCLKGDTCSYKHQTPPVCNKGPECVFLAQNRCRFHHPGYLNNNDKSMKQRECKFKNDCWKISTCSYFHPQQGFQFVQRSSRPPRYMGTSVRNMDLWRDY